MHKNSHNLWKLKFASFFLPLCNLLCFVPLHQMSFYLFKIAFFFIHSAAEKERKWWDSGILKYCKSYSNLCCFFIECCFKRMLLFFWYVSWITALVLFIKVLNSTSSCVIFVISWHHGCSWLHHSQLDHHMGLIANLIQEFFKYCFNLCYFLKVMI